MTTSKTIAGLIGPTFVAIAASMLLNIGSFPALAEQVSRDPALIFVSGILLFVAGLAIVRVHNRWTNGWPVLVTVLGWLFVLGGLARMLFPTGLSAPKRGASCRTTRTRSRRGRASEYAVNLGGHDEVVLMQSLDLLGLQRDRRIAPTEADIRMMAFGFREFTNLLNKGKRLAEIAKPKAPLDAVSFLHQLPVWGLFAKELSLLAREWGYSAATGSTGFASKSFGHVACPSCQPSPA